MKTPILNQIVVGATVGDAITDQALLLRQWLREMGFQSEIYAEHIHPMLEKEVRPATGYRKRPGESYLIFHHSIGTPLVQRLLALPLRLILIYHNVTPPDFFLSVDPALARQVAEGQEQLRQLRPHTDLALADSPFNEQDLVAAGFAPTGVLPIALDESQYDWPTSPELVAKYACRGPLLLFVGRLVPNKKQEDLLKLFYYYRRIEPAARLVLVGDPWLPSYGYWLRDLAWDLGLEASVQFTGHVSQQELVTYYRLADLYVSMSEHEGFGKPLIESMYLDLPVLAYAEASVPGTLGGAGVLFHHKHHEGLAELVDILVRNTDLRTRILDGQRKRVQFFLEAQVRRQWQGFLQSVPNETR